MFSNVVTPDTLIVASGPSGTQRNQTNTFCPRSVLDSFSWFTFLTLFFCFVFLSRALRTQCITARNLRLSSCLKSEQVCVCVCVYKHHSLLLHFGRMSLKTRSCWFHPRFLGKKSSHFLCHCVSVCLCVGGHLHICVGGNPACIYAKQKNCMKFRAVVVAGKNCLSPPPRGDCHHWGVVVFFYIGINRSFPCKIHLVFGENCSLLHQTKIWAAALSYR